MVAIRWCCFSLGVLLLLGAPAVGVIEANAGCDTNKGESVSLELDNIAVSIENEVCSNLESDSEGSGAASRDYESGESLEPAQKVDYTVPEVVEGVGGVIETVSETIENATFNVQDYEYIAYASTSLNIRDYPGVDGNQIGYFGYGETVEVTGTIEGSEWVRVSRYGRTGYCNSNYLLDEKPVPVIEEVKPVGAVIYDGAVSQNMVDGVYKYYSTIPEALRKRFESDNWVVNISTRDFGSEWGFSKSVVALFCPPKDTIYIDANHGSSAFSSVVHEMGHYLDMCCGNVSYRDEFVEIWNAELDFYKSFSSAHPDNYNTPHEYFAEAFASCILEESTMREKCSLTYEYIMGLSNSL